METHFHQLYPHEFFNRISDNSIDKWMETWLERLDRTPRKSVIGHSLGTDDCSWWKGCVANGGMVK